MAVFKNLFIFCLIGGGLVVGMPAFSACNTNNLVRCLDSACVKNSSNMGERCALCGSALAADFASKPSNRTAFNAGNRNAASNFLLSDAELQAAPASPEKRYVWAAGECIKKVSDCNASDAGRVYDPFIEQSCRFVLSDQQYAAISETLRSEKSISACRSDLQNCIMQDSKCGTDFAKCTTDATFTARYSECIVNENCGHFTVSQSDDLQKEILEMRAGVFAAKEVALQKIIAAYSAKRSDMAKTLADTCAPEYKQQFMQRYCSVMPNSNYDEYSCTFGNDAEQGLAQLLSEFIDTACGVVD